MNLYQQLIEDDNSEKDLRQSVVGQMNESKLNLEMQQSNRDENEEIAKLDLEFEVKDPIPPNWNLVQLHKESTMIKVPKSNKTFSQDQYCKCCGVLTTKHNLESLEDLKKIKLDYYLFFNFLNYATYFCLITFAISGLFNIITSFSSHNCSTMSEIQEKIVNQSLNCYPYQIATDSHNCYRSFAMDLSLANKLDEPEKMFTLGIMNLLTIIAQIIFFWIFVQNQKTILFEEALDKIDESDLAVKVKFKMQTNKFGDISELTTLDPKYKDYLIDKLETQLSEFQIIYPDGVDVPEEAKFKSIKLQVEYIEIATTMDQFIEYKKYYQEMLKLKRSYKMDEFKNIKYIDQEEKTERIQNELKKKLAIKKNELIGIAFVIFKTETGKRQFLELKKNGIKQDFMNQKKIEEQVNIWELQSENDEQRIEVDQSQNNNNRSEIIQGSQNQASNYHNQEEEEEEQQNYQSKQNINDDEEEDNVQLIQEESYQQEQQQIWNPLENQDQQQEQVEELEQQEEESEKLDTVEEQIIINELGELQLLDLEYEEAPEANDIEWPNLSKKLLI